MQKYYLMLNNPINIKMVELKSLNFNLDVIINLSSL